MTWKNRLGAMAFCLLFVAVAAAQQQPQSQMPSPNTSPGPVERRHGRGEGPGHGGMGYMRHALGQLNLTEQQRQQVHSIMERFMASTEAQREELGQLHMQREQGTFTPEQVERARNLRQQVQQASKSMDNEIIGLLTAEQRTQLDQIREDFRARREERRERRRGGEIPPQQ
ncbi:MAG TPA: Spy/CpxP family protein refolding chaperone, partial [Pyrinomonadaceae bacterium]|nr:Spy/CpxP family protein refolding chaperone [Pyrinomonadaceae bacterium]